MDRIPEQAPTVNSISTLGQISICHIYHVVLVSRNINIFRLFALLYERMLQLDNIRRSHVISQILLWETICKAHGKDVEEDNFCKCAHAIYW